MGTAQVTWLLVLLSVLLLLGWYLSYTAGRLDRLHHKVTATRTALDVQLLRRAQASIDAAQYLDPASALMVTDVASRAIAIAEQDADGSPERDPLETPPDLESTESDLSRALGLAFAEPWPGDVDGFARDSTQALGLACARVQLARRLYNDAVAQALRLRRKRVVRWARLAGRAPIPQMIEFEDEVSLPTA